jgi:hypothetical protein
MVSLCLDDLAQFGPFSSPSEQPFTVFFSGLLLLVWQAIFESIFQSTLSVHHFVVKIVSEQYKFRSLKGWKNLQAYVCVTRDGSLHQRVSRKST